MKKLFKYIFFSFILASLSACEDDWLEREPSNILLTPQVWEDPDLVVGLLSNFYDRLPTHVSLSTGWTEFAAYDEAMWSGFSNLNGLNNIPSYGFDRWGLWDYGLIRDINLSLQNLEENGGTLEENVRAQFKAEFRFIRAYVYFEHVKRMGGVPIITEQLIYDFGGDPEYLQFPRNTEEEVYDFIAFELDEIMEDLGNEGSKTRANKYTALALKSRAMLYAGSLARYNSMMPSPITTPGGEVGIPASRAEDYYAASLEASRKILNGPYSLYRSNPDLGENFYEALTNKSQNSEVIWAQDFLLSADKRHGFTYENIARSIREDNLSSSAITPTLNLVEDFEYLDGTSGELKTRTADGSDFIYYDELDDIFDNKDARLYGTVIYPGTSFNGKEVEIQAGVMVWDEASGSYQTIEGTELGQTWEGDGQLLTGAAGPHRTINEVSNTGFYLRKYIDPAPGASTRGIRSDMWWVRFRLGEIYLNAAEAAFELNDMEAAAGYLNIIRERAGFGPESLAATDVDFDQIRNERRVELAFEDHIVWDLKRWRIAHEVWNGNANNPDAMAYALYPYRIVRPGDARDGKYVFVELVAPRFVAPRFFQFGNYYSLIGDNIVNANPKIVRNPFH